MADLTWLLAITPGPTIHFIWFAHVSINCPSCGHHPGLRKIPLISEKAHMAMRHTTFWGNDGLRPAPNPKISIITPEWVVWAAWMNSLLSSLPHPVPEMLELKHNSPGVTQAHQTRRSCYFAVSRYCISCKVAKITCKILCKSKVPISDVMLWNQMESVAMHLICFSSNFYFSDVILLI